MKKKVIFVLCCALFLVTGCGKVPVLKNGEEVFAQIDGKNVSANDIYNELKAKYGTDVMIEVIDKILLEEKYPDSDEITDYVDAQISNFIAQYGEEGFNSALEQSGMTEDDLRAQVALDYRRTMAAEDYVAGTITDDEINSYYETDIRGDIKASHILIKPDVADDATDEEKTKAEEEAKKQAEEIITKLNNGENFADLAKEYSDDEGSKENGGDLGYFPKGEMVDEFENAVVELKVDEYTKEPVKSSFGYHIILKTGEKEKPELKSVKDEIIDSLVSKKISEDTTLQYKAIYEVRKEAGLEIHDDEVKSQYESYMNRLMTPTSIQ